MCGEEGERGEDSQATEELVTVHCALTQMFIMRYHRLETGS